MLGSNSNVIFAERRGILPKSLKCVVDVWNVSSRGISSGTALSGVSSSCTWIRTLKLCLMWNPVLWLKPGVRMVLALGVPANWFLMLCLGLQLGVRMVPAPWLLVLPVLTPCL